MTAANGIVHLSGIAGRGLGIGAYVDDHCARYAPCGTVTNCKTERVEFVTCRRCMQTNRYHQLKRLQEPAQ